MIVDEVREALGELAREIGARVARVTGDGEPHAAGPARSLPLGGGEYLHVEVAPRPGAEDELEAALSRATLRLRAIRRRWDVVRLPEIAVAPGAALPSSATVLERVVTYIRALGGIDRATNAFVTRGASLVAAARAPEEGEAARWPLLARRALASPAPGSSHGEVIDRDAYAMSFWYDATLVVLLDEPYALDFVRHRCRQVARELCHLLPLLEPDPDAPAAIGPCPGTPKR